MDRHCGSRLVVLALLLCPWAEALPSTGTVTEDVYDPKSIVVDATGPECPTTNVFWNKKTEINYEEMPKYGSLLREQNVSQRCQAIAFSDMSLCHVDRTYSIKRGCCSKKCSQAFNRIIESGCNIEFRVANCKDRSAWPLLLAVDALSKRCSNYTELTWKEALAEHLDVLLARHLAGRNETAAAAAPVASGSSVVAQVAKPGNQTSTSMGHAWQSAATCIFSAVLMLALI